MRLAALLPVGLSFALAASAPADAQSRHDSDAPIDVDAAHIELQDRANRVLLSGAVRIRQAEMTLTAARVTVNYTGGVTQGSPQASRLDAAGGVTVTRPDQSATSQYAVYDLGDRVITMIGGVTLKQGANVVRGARLLIDLDTGRATIDGSGVSSGPAGTQQQGGRVTGASPCPSVTPRRNNARFRRAVARSVARLFP